MVVSISTSALQRFPMEMVNRFRRRIRRTPIAYARESHGDEERKEPVLTAAQNAAMRQGDETRAFEAVVAPSPGVIVARLSAIPPYSVRSRGKAAYRPRELRGGGPVRRSCRA